MSSSPPLFAESTGFMLGTRGGRTGAELLTCCPICAAERMKVPAGHDDEVNFVQELHGDGGECAGCKMPLTSQRRACDALTKHGLLDFMGRVLKMAEREQKAGAAANAGDLAATFRKRLRGPTNGQ